MFIVGRAIAGVGCSGISTGALTIIGIKPLIAKMAKMDADGAQPLYCPLELKPRSWVSTWVLDNWGSLSDL